MPKTARSKPSGNGGINGVPPDSGHARPMSDEGLTDRGGTLRCVECGARADDRALGWRAYLTVDDEPATYCPGCAEREFDGP